MLRSEGLGVPLGCSRGLGSASVGLLRAWECIRGALGGLWLQNSLSTQNRIIRSNLKNTDIYVINTIRCIIRLRRMTHPWYVRMPTSQSHTRMGVGRGVCKAKGAPNHSKLAR